MPVEIITNHQPRPVLSPWELTEAERADFDYLDWEALEEGRDSRDFVRYKGWLYDLSDTDPRFQRENDPFREWDMVVSDSFFSGVLFRWLRDDGLYGETVVTGDYVICGRYYAS